MGTRRTNLLLFIDHRASISKRGNREDGGASWTAGTNWESTTGTPYFSTPVILSPFSTGVTSGASGTGGRRAEISICVLERQSDALRSASCFEESVNYNNARMLVGHAIHSKIRHTCDRNRSIASSNAATSAFFHLEARWRRNERSYRTCSVSRGLSSLRHRTNAAENLTIIRWGTVIRYDW